MKGKIVKKMMKASMILLILVGLLGVSSVALAEHEETHPEDTMFSFGYDVDNHFLAINIGPNGTLYECIFENGTLKATYGNEVGGVIQVDKLEEGTTVKTPKEFGPRAQAELADGLTEVSTAALYSGATDVCGVSGVVIAGPNGQIIGKGNDPSHLTVSEAEALAFVFGGAGTTGDIEFTTVEADCNRGKKDDGTATASASSGRTKGKSADAPGHNK